ncbi:hypothetical protein V6Z11_A12G290500 [Gossypium hirsutum]
MVAMDGAIASHKWRPFNRSCFPPGFIFGAGSAAYQIEGAALEDGKGPSVWDILVRKHPERIVDRSTGDVAVDFYHRYKEDIMLMKKIGLDSFRFSISWTRILPTGKLSGGINRLGVQFYNNLIDDLLANGLKPFVTLLHFDHPQALEDEYGGFSSPKIVFMDPVIYGEYPKSMQSLVGNRLPKFTEAESKLLKGSIDFLGANYYTTNYAENGPSNTPFLPTDAGVNLTTEKNGVPIGTPTDVSWLFNYPKGLRDLLLYLKKKYNSPTIYITENAKNASLTVKEALKDSTRIRYLDGHLKCLLKAIQEGVNMKGHYMWAFLDDFEWTSGYTLRFGFTYTDYKNNLRRYLKYSAYWFKKFFLN